MNAIETVRDVSGCRANAAKQQRNRRVRQRYDVQSASAPTAEVTDFVFDCAEFKLVLTRRTGAVNAEQDRRRGIGDRVNTDAVVVGAVIEPYTEASEVVFSLDIAIRNWICRRFCIADQADVEIGERGA